MDLLYVQPNVIKRYLGFPIIFNYIYDFICILVPISALMKSEDSIVEHGGSSDNASVLLHHVKWLWTSEEKQVYRASEHLKLDAVRFNDRIHAERVT